MKKVQKANANSSVKNLISPAKQDKRHACILIKRAATKLRKRRNKMLRKIFHVNDGLDGVVLAKSRRQVIHILAKEYGYHKSVLRQYVKNERKGKHDDEIWDVQPACKESNGGRSRVLGYFE